MRALFALTLFVSSALLFLVQPMIAKMILPRFGGSPAVWNTSLVFFQAMLLLGYLYAHASVKVLGPRLQAVVHLALVALAFVILPIAVPEAFGSGMHPSLAVIWLLTLSVGLAFFVLSAGAPLLQAWFARTKHPDSKDPYFLYRSSNLGSMLALLGYPLLFEPTLRLSQQSVVWSAAYGLLALLMVFTAVALWRQESAPAEIAPAPVRVDNWTRFTWVALAFVPTSLMLGVTMYLTSDITPMPLLWVIPLAIFLYTYILAFARRPVFSSRQLGRALPIAVTPLALAMVLEATEPIWLLALIHLVVFFIAALMCHTRISETRPAPSRLTEFYLLIAFGGVLGGAFTALIAPVIFNVVAEYPLAIVLAAMLRPMSSAAVKLDFLYPLVIVVVVAAAVAFSRWMGMEPGVARTALTMGLPAILCFLAADRPVRFALSLGVFFLMANIMAVATEGRVIETVRTFFGVHRVLEVEDGRFHALVHGNTVHGKQSTLADERAIPLTYYHPTGPIGHLFRALEGDSRLDSLGLVGLGVGSIAAYGKPGQRFVFYEIDEAVENIARDRRLFSFLSDSQADVSVVLGDARLSLRDTPAGVYGVMVLDAFSSDSIPIHLLTREAVALYLSKLQPDGILAFHISNRYLRLKDVLGDVAGSLGLAVLYHDDHVLLDDEADQGKEPSQWLLMSRSRANFGGLTRIAGWEDLRPRPGARVWTDDYSNVIQAFGGGAD